MPSTRPHTTPTLLSLPTEIRLEILTHVYDQSPNTGFVLYRSSLLPKLGLYIDDSYSSSSALSLLLTCRQSRSDFTELAFSRTHFMRTNTLTPVLRQLTVLRPIQISTLRHISFVAGLRQFREMVNWSQDPFFQPNLRLDTLGIVLQRSEERLHPGYYTADMAMLLRRLTHVKVLRFVRNGANVKGGFKAWYNVLIGLMMKEDHRFRYDVDGAPHLPAHWWEWTFDAEEWSFELMAVKPMEAVEEGVYMERVKPWVGELMGSMESEEGM